VFGRQVQFAAEAGVVKIETHAARGQRMNGYYTWARFGYDATLPHYGVRDALPPSLAGAERLSDLMATAEGRAWWKEKGDTIHAEFDLAEGSLSRRVLDAYLAAREAAVAATP
jgi:hypothetical protein